MGIIMEKWQKVMQSLPVFHFLKEFSIMNKLEKEREEKLM